MAQQEREGKMTEFVLRSIVIGVGATAVYDLWGRLLVGLFGLPGSNWAMAGRWFSHMTRGQFTHANITAAPAMPYETIIGWTMHYLIGIVYAGVLLAIWGLEWGAVPLYFRRSSSASSRSPPAGSSWHRRWGLALPAPRRRLWRLSGACSWSAIACSDWVCTGRRV